MARVNSRPNNPFYLFALKLVDGNVSPTGLMSPITDDIASSHTHFTTHFARKPLAINCTLAPSV